MLQCVLEFLTEFVLRFYSKRLFLDKFRFPVCRQSGDLSGVCGNTLSSENEVLFLPWYFLELRINLYTQNHSALLSSPLCKDLLQVKPSAVPQAHRSHSNTENGIKAAAHHIMEISVSLPKNPLHSHGHS